MTEEKLSDNKELKRNEVMHLLEEEKAYLIKIRKLKDTKYI